MNLLLRIAVSCAFTLTIQHAAFAQCGTATNIITVAGNHTSGYSGDGGAGTSAQMGSPYAVVSDAAGNVFIADYFNNVVRKLNIYGVMSTVAGTGEPGYNGENLYATESRLNGPAGLAVDAIGNLYIADKFNERIRKVDGHTGRMTTIAGNGQHGGWNGAEFGNGGLATAASLTYPVAVALDCTGNIYIADNGSQTVRKIDPTGIITRFAGTHEGGYNGDAIAATSAMLNSPNGIAADCAGNVYIADSWNNRVRKVDGSGIITTYAGKGDFFTGPDVIGDNGPATAALLVPYGLHADTCGNVFVGSTLFNLRVVTPFKPVKGIVCDMKIASAPSVAGFAEGDFSIFPNPGSGQFSFRLSTPLSQEVQIMVTDITGRVVTQISTATNRDNSLLLNEAPGMYFIQATTPNGRWSEKLIIQ